jgi:hypothetical protein
VSTEEPMRTEEPMSIEDRVRTATRAGATLVTDIRPLAEPERVRFRRRPAPAARRWRTWGIPLAAAAAVVLVALSLVAVRQFSTTAPPTGGPVSNGPATTVPRYYVALDPKQTQPDGYTGTGDLIIGDDHTGQAIGTVTPPHGLVFAEVQGASDDRTFIVQATSAKEPQAGEGPETWYLLRIAPGTVHPYQLTKLPIKLPGSSPEGFAYALSPDGRELAVESQNGPTNVFTLGIYSMSSGAELRAWTTDADVGSGPAQDNVSWTSDGRQLAFTSFLSHPERYQLRTLDVTGSGTDLMAASRALLTVPLSGESTCDSLHLTPDGGTIVCAKQYALVTGATINAGCANGGLGFTAYSARTGKPVRVLYQYRAASCFDGISTLRWTNASATEIIGATQIDIGNQGGKQAGQLGVITDGHIRLLKLPKSVSPTYYGVVAF